MVIARRYLSVTVFVVKKTWCTYLLPVFFFVSYKQVLIHIRFDSFLMVIFMSLLLRFV